MTEQLAPESNKALIVLFSQLTFTTAEKSFKMLSGPYSHWCFGQFLSHESCPRFPQA